MASNSVILKPRHSLQGISFMPVILKIKTSDPPETLARLKRDHPLDRYSHDELVNEFHKLTGETARGVMQILEWDDNVENLRTVMHHSIIHANAHGAPKGQILTPVDMNTSNTGQGPTPGTASVVTVGTSISTAAATVTKSQGDLETRLNAMEQNVMVLKSQTADNKVEDALRHVRILASRPKLTPSHVLIASLEMLVDVATQASCKDAEFYGKALQACRRYEDSEDLCGLCLKLLGSNEDRKICNAISEWVKGKKYDLGDGSNYKGKKEATPQGPYPLPSLMVPYGMQQFGTSSFPPYGAPMPMFFGPGGVRPPGRRFSGPRLCFFCKQRGHFVADCPKMKKE